MMSHAEIVSLAESIAARMWERGSSADAIEQEIAAVFADQDDAGVDLAQRTASRWIDAVENVEGE